MAAQTVNDNVDVFAELNEICKTNIVAKINKNIPKLALEDDEDIDLESLYPVTKNSKKGKPKQTKQKPPKTVSPKRILSKRVTRSKSGKKSSQENFDSIEKNTTSNTNIDCIDLSDSCSSLIDLSRNDTPSPIELEETSSKAQTADTESLIDTNQEISIKIKFHGKLEVFKLRKYQKFISIFQQIAERESVPIEQLAFNLDNRIIRADDTPADINYKIFHFIHGRVLMNKLTDNRSLAKFQKNRSEITLKIQSDKWKEPKKVNIRATDTFKILYIKCSEELNIPIDAIRLSFDGDSLNYDQTPTDFEITGGEVIDIHFDN